MKNRKIWFTIAVTMAVMGVYASGGHGTNPPYPNFGLPRVEEMMFLVLQIGVIIFAAKLGGMAASFFKLPSILGELAAGIVIGHRMDSRLYRIRLNDPSVLEVNYPVELDGTMRDCAYVELGDPGIPHAVVPIVGLDDFPERLLFDLGRKLRYHEAFPKGANVNFYEITGEVR